MIDLGNDDELWSLTLNSMIYRMKVPFILDTCFVYVKNLYIICAVVIVMRLLRKILLSIVDCENLIFVPLDTFCCADQNKV